MLRSILMLLDLEIPLKSETITKNKISKKVDFQKMMQKTITMGPTALPGARFCTRDQHLAPSAGTMGHRFSISSVCSTLCAISCNWRSMPCIATTRSATYGEKG